jgi:hypothetical protein
LLGSKKEDVFMKHGAETLVKVFCISPDVLCFPFYNREVAVPAASAGLLSGFC